MYLFPIFILTPARMAFTETNFEPETCVKLINKCIFIYQSLPSSRSEVTSIWLPGGISSTTSCNIHYLFTLLQKGFILRSNITDIVNLVQYLHLANFQPSIKFLVTNAALFLATVSQYKLISINEHPSITQSIPGGFVS